MKQVKKIMVAVVAVVMVLAMTIPAMAATITIDPETPDDAATGTTSPIYSYYQMMIASVDTNGTSYYVGNSTLAKALADLKVNTGTADTPVYEYLFTVTRVGTTDHWNVVMNPKKNGSLFTGEEVAAALYTIKEHAIAKGTASNNQINIDGDGYVLIESSLGTLFMADTLTTKTIKEKNTYPSNTKSEDKSNAEIGETVTYTINVVIPNNVAKKEIVVRDNFSDGLTMNTAITVKGGTEISSLTWEVDNLYSENGRTGYRTTIPAENVIANKGKTLILTYTGTVNEKAVVGTPETNKAHIEYDNFKTVEAVVEVKTFGFELEKQDGSSKPLAGVKFTLTRDVADETYYYTEGSNPSDNNEARFSLTKNEVTTSAEGKITFSGLHAGTYTLTETETVSGFNLLTEAITVTIDENGSATFSGAGVNTTGASDNTVTIVNRRGTELPSTGGIGTTVFYVIGGILVVIAGVLLVVKRRMKAEK